MILSLWDFYWSVLQHNKILNLLIQMVLIVYPISGLNLPQFKIESNPYYV